MRMIDGDVAHGFHYQKHSLEQLGQYMEATHHTDRIWEVAREWIWMTPR
jgi:hypothetical protein